MIEKIGTIMKEARNGRMRFFSPQRLVHKAILLTPKPWGSDISDTFSSPKQYSLKPVFDRMKEVLSL